MKSRFRRSGRSLGIAAAVAAAAVTIAACGSSSSSSPTSAVNSSLGTVIYGTLPPVGTPASGGVITQGQLTGQTPNYIFPIAPSANSGTGTFSLFTELFMPLYAGPLGAEPKINYGLSAASGPPVFSDNDKIVTINLKPGLKWSNGAPVNATDVVFWFDLLKAAIKESPANWGQFSLPTLFPGNVTSVTTSGADTVVFHLNGTYNPGFFLNNQIQDTNGGAYPLPATAWNVDSAGGPHLSDWSNPAVAKKIFDYLNKQGASVSTFASSPLWKDVSGPFKLSSFSATNSSYVLTPNPSYGGTPKSKVSQIQVDTFTGFTSELDALRGGTLDVAVGLDPSQLPQAPALKSQGIDLYGGPGWGWFGGIINFKDKTNDFNNVIAQPYVRGALMSLYDQPAIIKGVYKNAAVPAYGPVPSAPLSPYAPANASTPVYPFSPSAAVSMLKSHGWDVKPGGTTTCAKPGTSSSECGVGIPKGTPISFVWANTPESFSTTSSGEAEALTSEAKSAAGINITLQTKTFNFLISDYNDANPAAVKYTNDWGVNNYGGLFTDFYPTGEGTWNAGGGFNTGGYSSGQADTLMNDSVHSGNVDAIKNEVSYFQKSLPVLFSPDADYLLAVNSKKVGGPAEGWTAMTQQQWFPQYWYTVK